MKPCRFPKPRPVIPGHLMVSGLRHQTEVAWLFALFFSALLWILLANKKDFQGSLWAGLSSELQTHRLSKAHNHFLLAAVSTSTIWTGRSCLEILHLDPEQYFWFPSHCHSASPWQNCLMMRLAPWEGRLEEGKPWLCFNQKRAWQGSSQQECRRGRQAVINISSL